MAAGIVFWGYRLWDLSNTVRAQSWAVQESMRLLRTTPEEAILDSALETATIARDTMQMTTWLAAAYGMMVAVCAFGIREEARRFRRTRESS